MGADFNKLYPAPKRAGLDDDSPEAIIQDVLKASARNGGAWLLGRHVFYATLPTGVTIKEAVLAAVTAAAKDSQNPQRRIKAGMDMFDQMYPEDGDPAAPSAPRSEPRKGFLTDLAAAFGSRRPANNR
jgi:hypothetical protein